MSMKYHHVRCPGREGLYTLEIPDPCVIWDDGNFRVVARFTDPEGSPNNPGAMETFVERLEGFDALGGDRWKPAQHVPGDCLARAAVKTLKDPPRALWSLKE